LPVEGAETGGALMEIANWLDTLLNVMVFAFIGAMLWFYLK
jgi:hypothetical protein